MALRGEGEAIKRRILDEERGGKGKHLLTEPSIANGVFSY